MATDAVRRMALLNAERFVLASLYELPLYTLSAALSVSVVLLPLNEQSVLSQVAVRVSPLAEKERLWEF